MKRKMMENLIKWKTDGCPKPYMLIGARQVGKTFMVKSFCNDYFKDHIYINLERDEAILDVFEKSLDPDYIMRQLSLIMNTKINIDDTIIFIDEIQVSERAITALKYFAEDEKDYKIIVAGSLLGVAMNRFKSSFPVGKIQRGYLYPLDFEEFLWALNREDLTEEIKACFNQNSQMLKAVHEQLLEYYKDYVYLGGMPESILEYIENGQDLMGYSNTVKQDILKDYLADMNKYASHSESLKIEKLFNSMPRQLGRDNNKFSYKLVESGASKRSFATSIDWLVSSHLVHKATLIETPRIPLKAYEKDTIFKLYLGDIGLLIEMARMSVYDVVSNESSLFSGMLAENYVCQTFAANNIDLYYWKSGNTAEIDFLVTIKGHIIPVEVKASTNKKSKALNTYIEKYSPEYAIRISQRNFGFDGKIKSVPLYAAYLIGSIR